MKTRTKSEPIVHRTALAQFISGTLFLATTLFCSVSFTSTTAYAADTSYNICFMVLESDGDGTVSKAEFTNVFPQGADVFSQADTNADGKLDHDEWEDWKATQGFEETHE